MRLGLEMKSLGRRLRSSPFYAISVVVIVSASTGLTVAAFSIFDRVLLAPLPYTKPENLFSISGGYLAYPDRRSIVASRDVDDWRAAAPECAFMASRATGTAGWLDSSQRLLTIRRVDGAWWKVLGVRPFLGSFAEVETTPERAVITYNLWKREYGGRPDIIGRLVEVSPSSSVEIGAVLPPAFVFPDARLQPDVLLSLRRQDAGSSRASRALKVIARCPPGSLATVSQKLSAAVVTAKPDWPANSPLTFGPFDTVTIESLESALEPQHAALVFAPFAIALVLLGLACGNLSGLLLARLDDHWREARIRLSLGATPTGAAIHILIEVTVLVMTGWLSGVGLAGLIGGFILEAFPRTDFFLRQPGLDAVTSVSAVLALCLTVAAVGILPFLRLRRAALGPGRYRGTSKASITNLVIPQVALGTTIVIAGFLVVGSLAKVWTDDPGINTDDLLVIDASTIKLATAQTLIDPIRVATHAAAVTLMDEPILTGMHRADVSWSNPSPRSSALCLGGLKIGVSTRYREATRLEVVAGRWFVDDEVGRIAPVAVISENVARQCWPQENPLGKSFTLSERTITVIGVVSDVKWLSVEDQSRDGAAYVPLGLLPESGTMSFLIRASPMTEAVRRSAVSVLRTNGVRIAQAEWLSKMRWENIAARRVASGVFGSAGVVALVVATTGIFGLIGIVIRKRWLEFAVRIAVGATPSQIVGKALVAVLMRVAIGLVVGVFTTWALMSVLLPYVKPGIADSTSLWLAAIVTMSAPALVASLLQLRKVLSIDAASLLREGNG